MLVAGQAFAQRGDRGQRRGARQAVGLDRQGLGGAGGEQVGDERAQVGEFAFGNLDAAAFAQRAQQAETLFRGGGGEDRDLDVDAAGALEVDLDQVGAARRQDPQHLAAVTGVRHLLGHHRVDAPADAAVVAARVAPAQGLVGLVDEDHGAAEGVDQAEDLFEVALGRADPFVAEVLQLHHRHPGLAGDALDEVGLAGADRAAQQVAHRQRLEVAGLPQRDVLADPGFDRVLAVDVVQRALGVDEFDQAAAFVLDQRLLGADQVGVGQRLVEVVARFQRRLDRAERGPGERGGRHRQIGEGARRARIALGQHVERGAHLGGVRQRHARARGARVGDQQGVEVGEIGGDQEGGEVVFGQRRIAGPIAHLAGQGVEFVAGARLVGQHQVGVAHDQADLRRLLAEPTKVDAVAEVVREQLDRFARAARHLRLLLEARPLGEGLAPALDAQAGGEVVAEHDVEARQQHLGEEFGQRAEFGAFGERQQEAILDVAVADELAGGAAFVLHDQVVGPARQVARTRGGHGGVAHGVSVWAGRWVGAGEAKPRSTSATIASSVPKTSPPASSRP